MKVVLNNFLLDNFRREIDFHETLKRTALIEQKLVVSRTPCFSCLELTVKFDPIHL